MDSYNQLYKIIVVGDAGVGKTHFINRLLKNSFPDQNAPTIGVEYASLSLNLQNGGQIKAQIWDTAGQEKYRAITSAHYKKSVGAILMYDITNDKSFESVQKWQDEIIQHAEEGIRLMLVGNKLDVVTQRPSLRKVLKKDAQQYVFYEVSSYIYEQIENIFQQFIEEVYYYQQTNIQNRFPSLMDSEFTLRTEFQQNSQKQNISARKEDKSTNCSCQ